MEIAGTSVTELIPRRQGRMLFTYLVVNRHRQSSRGELVEALWSGAIPPDAEGALSTVLSRLRRAIGPDSIEGRSEVRLVLPHDTWIDYEAADEAIHRAESAIAQRLWARAWGPSLVALFVARRGFLRGEEAAWIEPCRRRLEDVHCSALECYTASALGLGGSELHVGERTARELITLAPFRESGYRLLMEILAERGNVAEALRAYEELRTLLREELGATPSPPIQALQVQLLKATQGPYEFAPARPPVSSCGRSPDGARCGRLPARRCRDGCSGQSHRACAEQRRRAPGSMFAKSSPCSACERPRDDLATRCDDH